MFGDGALQFREFMMGPVRQRLEAMGAELKVLATWQELVAQEIMAENEEDEFSE